MQHVHGDTTDAAMALEIVDQALESGIEIFDTQAHQALCVEPHDRPAAVALARLPHIPWWRRRSSVREPSNGWRWPAAPWTSKLPDALSDRTDVAPAPDQITRPLHSCRKFREQCNDSPAKGQMP